MSIICSAPQPLTREEVIYRVTHPPPVIGVDVETISLKERMPLGFSIATSPTESFYFNTYPEPEPEVALVESVLQDPKIKKVFHNAFFDMRAFPLLFEIDYSNIADTNVMARLLGKQYTRLTDLAPDVGRLATPFDSMGVKTMLEVPNEKRAEKCCNDSQVTLALYEKYLPHIDQEYFAIEMAVIPVLIEMSLRGLKVHQEDRAKLEVKVAAEKESYLRICEELDFSPGSNQQVGYVLAMRGNFLRFTRSKKQLSVRAEDLEFLDDPLAAVVLNYRHCVTQLSRYLVPLANQDRIYTDYSLDISVGRVQSSNRNMQNIPENMRYIYIPDSGTFTTGDFSQEHLRILAYRSGDRLMKRVYEEGYMEGNIHKFTSSEMHIPYKLAKVINYAIPYGGTPKTVSENAKIKDLRKCSDFLERWFRLFKDAAEWIRGAQDEGIKSGWALPTLFGRRLRIPDEENEDARKRKAVNYPILGSDGEVMKRALLICKKYDLPLAVQVHDSITLDGDCEFPKDELENITPFRLPLEIKKTERWE